MEDIEIHDLTAAYALNALDADERAAYEAHLRRCDRCRDELARLGDAAGMLAYAAEGPTPPPELRERILAAARDDQGVVVAFPRRRRLVPALGIAAAVAASVAIGLGIWAASLSGELDELRQAQAILAHPQARSVELEGAPGRLVVGPEGQATLVTSLDPAPSGKTYELWVIEGDTAPRPAGLFDDTGDPVLVDEPVPDGAVVAVTVEDDGGVDAPTTEPLVTAQA